MTTLTARLALATGLALATAGANAATLGLGSSAPVITGSGDVLYLPGSDLSFLGTTDTGLDVSAAVALAPSGGHDTTVSPGALIAESAFSGDVTALGYAIDAGIDGGDMIELLLTVTGGDLTADLGSQALAVLTGEFGIDDTFASAEFFSSADIEISPLTDIAPIPLPAGGLLLLTGLAAFGLRRRAAR